MNILITGASGFLGKHCLAQLLCEHKITTMSRKDSDILADITKEVPNLQSFNLTIHCAGKAHSVPKTAMEKQAFFDVNLTGTANLLKGLEQSEKLPESFVFISTVAVYGIESGEMITENHSLNAQDPYGLSKIQAEHLVQAWCAKNKVICSILRLPLLLGENPPGNLGAMIKGIKKGYYFDIAGGKAKKSMVLAEDVARIIPIAAEIGGIYNLTDGYHPSFFELSNLISNQLNKSSSINIPNWVAKPLGWIGDIVGNKFPINSNKLQKITSDLTFDDSLARQKLGWNPVPVLKGFKIS